MKCQATILTVADVSQIRTLPDAYTSVLLVDIHEGRVEKGDIVQFNGLSREVLDVATNTDFFDVHAEGSLGVAIGGDPIDGRDAIGRSMIVVGD